MLNRRITGLALSALGLVLVVSQVMTDPRTASAGVVQVLFAIGVLSLLGGLCVGLEEEDA